MKDAEEPKRALTDAEQERADLAKAIEDAARTTIARLEAAGRCRDHAALVAEVALARELAAHPRLSGTELGGLLLQLVETLRSFAAIPVRLDAVELLLRDRIASAWAARGVARMIG